MININKPFYLIRRKSDQKYLVSVSTFSDKVIRPFSKKGTVRGMITRIITYNKIMDEYSQTHEYIHTYGPPVLRKKETYEILEITLHVGDGHVIEETTE